MVQGAAGSGTKCHRVWYKVLQGLVQGAAETGTSCGRVWYEEPQGLMGSGASYLGGQRGRLTLLTLVNPKDYHIKCNKK